MWELPSCFDFDSLFSGIKHNATDTGIQDWHVLEFSRKSTKPGEVFVRTKRTMDAEQWVPWRKGTADESRFWPNASGGEMPGPSEPELAALKEWKDKDQVLKDLRWLLHEQQEFVRVSDADKAVFEEYITGIPESKGDVEAPRWPAITQQEGGSQSATPAHVGGSESKQEACHGEASGVDEEEDTEGRAVIDFNVPAEEAEAAGLRMQERTEARRVAEANAAFRQRSRVKKNELLVFFNSVGGRLEMGQPVADCQLTEGETLRVQYWVNKKVADTALSKQQQRALANAAPDFKGAFMKYQKKWVDEFSPTDVVVFWAGPKEELLRKDGSIRKGKRRLLSRLSGFPLAFDDQEGDWKQGGASDVQSEAEAPTTAESDAEAPEAEGPDVRSEAEEAKDQNDGQSGGRRSGLAASANCQNAAAAGRGGGARRRTRRPRAKKKTPTAKKKPRGQAANKNGAGSSRRSSRLRSRGRR